MALPHPAIAEPVGTSHSCVTDGAMLISLTHARSTINVTKRVGTQSHLAILSLSEIWNPNAAMRILVAVSITLVGIPVLE